MSLPSNLNPSSRFLVLALDSDGQNSSRASPRQVHVPPSGRPTKQLSYELANHAKAYLEGGQIACGYDFLHSLLATVTSASGPAPPYAGLLAPPAYIAFASSLIVYPDITTKAQSMDAIKGSNAALRYLQCVTSTIESPVFAEMRKSFTFPEERTRRRAPHHRDITGSASPEPSSNIEKIAGEAANAKCLWQTAEDFWHTVGWAFNCSVVHKKRWDRWKLWLNAMLDLIEADWDACVEQCNSNTSHQGSQLQASLIWHYLVGEADSVNRGVRRRVIKAILAMATQDSLKEFPAVWKNETAGAQQEKAHNESHEKIRFETGEMADYGSEEEMDDESYDPIYDDTALGFSGDLNNGNIKTIDQAVERLGGQESIVLRQRLIAFLAEVAIALPAQFTSLTDFFDHVLEDFTPLPTIVLQVLVSKLQMPGILQISFLTNLLLPLVSSKLPNFLNNEPTRQHFEETLLPLRGTTQSFAANAKISLILEQTMLYMMNLDALEATDELRTAMEIGIKARKSVHGTGRGKRGNLEEEALGQKLLQSSSERLLGLLEVLEIMHGKAPQPQSVVGKLRD